MGKDLGPDSRGFLKIKDFMWAMSRPVLVEVLAPVAPQLLGRLRDRLQQLKSEYLMYRAELTAKSNPGIAGAKKKTAKNPQEVKFMEKAFHENILTKKNTEEVVRKFIDSIQKVKQREGAQGLAHAYQSDKHVSDNPKGDTAATAHAVVSSASPLESRSTGPTVSSLHILILVDRMDCERPSDRDQMSAAGAVTEESMLKVLQEFSHDQVFQEDLRLFQESVGSIISGTLEGSKDRWVDPEKGQLEAIKEFTGVVVHSKGVLSQVGRAPLSRQHMRTFFGEHDSSQLPVAMRPSVSMKNLADKREREVYNTNPWKTFWQESARKPRMAHGGSVGKSGVGQQSPAAILAAAQDKVRKALFQRFDNITSAFAAMDNSSKGVVSMTDFKKSISDLRIGLSSKEIDTIIAAEAGGEFILYADFLDKYSTPVHNLASIAEARSRAGVYSRLRKDLSQASSEGLPTTALEETDDPDRAAARAAAGLVPFADGARGVAQV